MSDNDRKKDAEFLKSVGESDWDNALDDWEKNSFTASVPPAEIAPAKPVSIPPPPSNPFGPEPATKPAQEEAVLAAVEATALRPSVPPPAPSSARGGLGQLFAKPSPSTPRMEDAVPDDDETLMRPSKPPPAPAWGSAPNPAAASAWGSAPNPAAASAWGSAPNPAAASAWGSAPNPAAASAWGSAPNPAAASAWGSAPNPAATVASPLAAQPVAFEPVTSTQPLPAQPAAPPAPLPSERPSALATAQFGSGIALDVPLHESDSTINLDAIPEDVPVDELSDELPDEETRELPALRMLPRAEPEPPKPATLLAPVPASVPASSERVPSDSETLVRASVPPPAPSSSSIVDSRAITTAGTRSGAISAASIHIGSMTASGAHGAPISANVAVAVPASRPRLDEKRLEKWTARIAWLEEEANVVVDPLARGRALLAVSELAAISGDRERALQLANEAKSAAPNLPLAGRQARMLLPREPELVAEALDAEASESPTSASRAHAVLLAADVMRVAGNADAALERWDSAYKLDPSDPRAPIARAAAALAQDNHGSSALRLAENSELLPLDKAIATALRLRGVERPNAEVEEMPINDGLRHARTALAEGDLVGAAQALGEIAAVPEIAHGALWLSAMVGSSHIAARRAAARSLKTLAAEDDPLAKRQLAARGIELGDPELVTAALGGEKDAFSAAERAVVSLLASFKGEADSAKLAGEPDLAPLADAVAALTPMLSEDGGREAITRARRVSGKQPTRALTAVGRLLAAKEADLGIDEALESVDVPSASAAGVILESAVHGKRWAEVSEALLKLNPEAAAIIAERAGDRERAKEGWRKAAKGGTAGEGVLRIAADLDPEVDLSAELMRIADEHADGLGPAILRLEAVARKPYTDDERAALFERVHQAAPSLGIGAFMAERVARRKGDLDEVLRWIAEHRNYATDPFESTLDAVREAFLIADKDAEVASRRLEEAHHARPDDVALRELYERLAVDSPDDRGAWREKRAAKASGPGAAALWLETAREYDRAGNPEAMLRAAKAAAEAGDKGLSGPLRDRGELATGDTTRQIEALMEVTKTSENDEVKREALERLADVDPGSAMLWHQAILEGTPRHLPSLRWLEQGLITEGNRDEELAPVFEQIALALDGTAGGEVTSHAQHSARLRARDGAGQPVIPGEPTAWERTHDMARLAATQPEASLWSLRALNAHARLRHDDEALFKTTTALLERTQRPAERGTLLLRASESAARLGQVDEARNFLEQAAAEDPGDVVTWGFLAEVRERAGDPKEAAEACESLARTSVVRDHQLLAWYDAAKIWGDEVHDEERAMTALENVAEIDPTHADVFSRLTALYAERRLDSELAHLLERRLESAHDDDERVALEVELARAFVDMGELGKAKTALVSALEKRPDYGIALQSLADVASREGDWSAAESAYVRLARLLPDLQEQRAIYEKLGEIYAIHAPNLQRAEVAYKEVLKRGADDLGVVAKLVDVYKRQGDVQKAVEMQQELIVAATEPDARLGALIELAKIQEQVGKDPRKSEQVLDSARKEFPTSVVALRAMAEFYSRQRQMPAMQILLDRAAGDARRSFAQGRFVPSLFQVLHAAFELRGKKDAAKVTAATLAAVEGKPSELLGAEARAVDPRLDDLLAPEMMSTALRTLFQRAGDALDAVASVDLRALKAMPLQPGTPIGATVGSVATVVGLGALQILVSPNLGRIAIPLATNPPTLLVGEGLVKTKNEAARMFMVVRALKMILTNSSALIRAAEHEVPLLVAALFTAFNPTYVPQGVDSKRSGELARRIGAALPRSLDPTVGVIALEAAGMVGNSWTALGAAGGAWANRAALLAVGDPNGALDALAWTFNEDAAPTDQEERAAWIARHHEARDLMTFSVTDAYSEARSRLGLDK